MTANPIDVVPISKPKINFMQQTLAQAEAER